MALSCRPSGPTLPRQPLRVPRSLRLAAAQSLSLRANSRSLAPQLLSLMLAAPADFIPTVKQANHSHLSFETNATAQARSASLTAPSLAWARLQSATRRSPCATCCRSAGQRPAVLAKSVRVAGDVFCNREPTTYWMVKNYNSSSASKASGSERRSRCAARLFAHRTMAEAATG